MLFNSIEFILIFLPLGLIIYFIISPYNATFAKIFLVIISLFFYSQSTYSYLYLLIVSILINYIISNILQNPYKKSKKILFIGIIFNLLILGYFKYIDFFIDTINMLFHTNFKLLNIPLPLAISFFTLQQIAFLVDCYENIIQSPTPNSRAASLIPNRIYNYFLFVTFFPQLIAGPIVHYNDTIPQFEMLKNRRFNFSNFQKGLTIFSIGLFKKVVIADYLALIVQSGFSQSSNITFDAAWVSSIAFTIQIYFDFSGYIDMALGIGKMFNINLPQNFRYPLLAKNIVDFWKRWHITLTNFLTSYIYIPLAKKFHCFTLHRAAVITLVTFLISGLWHGASWMFVIFGLIHGVAVALYHYYQKTKFRLPSILAWFTTFSIVNIAFVFFRAPHLQIAKNMLSGMYLSDMSLNYLMINIKSLRLEYIIFLLAPFYVYFEEKLNNFLENCKNNLAIGTVVGIILWICFKTMLESPSKEFLYFAF